MRHVYNILWASSLHLFLAQGEQTVNYDACQDAVSISVNRTGRIGLH